MNFIERIKERAKSDKKTIVLPETMDKRVLDATKMILDEDIADLILIGKESFLLPESLGFVSLYYLL